ncbi:MAG: hypothetical protein L6R42_001336 [Xanthoria sp. 1 TBL-2021]|nr:MAG: hypothetical protein L6R42_001336 [Xanthoria sp. 1 TBL-2021]
MALSRNPRCAFCNSSNEGHLSRCAACSVVHYCNRDRQAAHRDAHKRVCNVIKKALQALDKEEENLRAHPGDWMTPPNLFEESVGHFWGIHETRPYMRSRYAVVEAYLAIDTYAAVEAARSNLADMLRLCRGDNMGVHDLCKWYATTGSEGDYDWGDMDLGFLDVKDADVFEPLVEGFLSKHGDLSFTVALTLLNIRLLLDLQALQNSSAIGHKVPQEILDRVRNQLVTTVVHNNAKIMNSADQTPLIKEIEKQVQALYTKAQQQNKHFWPVLLKPEADLGARPNSYSPRSPQRMEKVWNYSYNSWKETPGAIEMIRKLQKSNAS